MEGGGRRKVNELLAIEAAVQKLWEARKPFEVDAPTEEGSTQAKYLVTFPFPYMNGRLHVGHTFSLSKAEFAVGFERMRGKRALFPFGFHATGMPIKACADKLKAEIANYGNPPQFPTDEADAVVSTPEPTTKETVVNKAKSKKSKAVAKAGTSKYQWNIMESLGLTADQIPKFADDNYWLDYFPAYCIQDLKLFGTKADFRRSFMTTERNLYFDSFVRWQFRKLRALNLIDYGKRHTIFSPKDGQACMDHDRASGEGIGPLEYTLMKLRIVSNVPEVLTKSGKPVYLVVASLQPQELTAELTNFVQPETKYVAFYAGANDSEIFVASNRVARNLAYQDLTKEDSGRVHYVEGVDTLKGLTFADAKLDSAPIKHEVQYMEPEKVVMSRSGDECVVALCDQWYLDYGNQNWKEKARMVVEQLETYGEEARNNLLKTIDWLHEYACSRLFGLGTKLPWDERWIIESLSDSTIYTCYYSVAHLLQKGSLDGKNVDVEVRPAQLNDAFWDYVLLDDASFDESAIKVPREFADRCRREFNFWRAPDCRVSGKDLISNHLTFYIFNHVAIFGNNTAKWPRGVRANGHLLLNNEKMSKSTGNFLTLTQAIEQFSTDGTRLALADAGDGLDDANFVTDTADSGLLRLYNMMEYTKEMLTRRAANGYRIGERTIIDRYFVNRFHQLTTLTFESYEKTEYKNALKFGLYEFQTARDSYRLMCGGEEQMHAEILELFTETQFRIIAPLCPHIAEHVWQLLGKKTLIVDELWPVFESLEPEILKELDFITEAARFVRGKLEDNKKQKLKKGIRDAKPIKATIYIADRWPGWQADVITMLSELCVAESAFPENRVANEHLKTNAFCKANNKKVMNFVQATKEAYARRGAAALEFECELDQKRILENSHVLDYLRHALETNDIDIVSVADSTLDISADIIEKAAPWKPWVQYEFSA